MQILIEIDDNQVAEAGTIILSNVNYGMFDEKTGKGLVLLPGFKVKDPEAKTPWFKIQISQPQKEKTPPNAVPFKTTKKKAKK